MRIKIIHENKRTNQPISYGIGIIITKFRRQKTISNSNERKKIIKFIATTQKHKSDDSRRTERVQLLYYQKIKRMQIGLIHRAEQKRT